MKERLFPPGEFEIGPPNSTLILTREPGLAEVNDLVSRRKRFTLGSARIANAIVSGNGTKVLLSLDDNVAELWDTKNERLGVRDVLADDQDTAPQSVSFLPDGQSLFARWGNRVARIVIEEDVGFSVAWKVDTPNIVDAALCAESATLALSTSSPQGHCVSVKNVPSGKLLLERHPAGADSILIAPDGDLLICAGEFEVSAIRLPSGEEAWNLPSAVGDRLEKPSLCFSPCGTRVFVADGKAVRVVDSLTGHALLRLHSDDYVRKLKFVESSGTLIAISEEGATIWLSQLGSTSR